MAKRFSEEPFILWVLFILCIQHPLLVGAWETDNYTCKTRPLADVTKPLNDETNRRLQLAMKNANTIPAEWVESRARAGLGQISREFVWIDLRRKESETERRRESVKTSLAPVPTENKDGVVATVVNGLLAPGDPLNSISTEELRKGPRCNREILQQYLYNAIASGWVDNLETWSNGVNIPKCEVEVEQSIFRVTTFSESPAAKSAGINPVVNVNGFRIGVDKLSHFMTEGYLYHREKQRGKSLSEVLKVGVLQEEGQYGLLTTGVKSFADLSANYKGLTFWQNLFDGDNPYFRCENGAWIQARAFDWREFVDSSLDETINCNEYGSPEFTAKVDAEAEKMWSKAGLKSKTCPATIEECTFIVDNFRPAEVLTSVIHPRCLSAGKYSGPIPAAISSEAPTKPSTMLELRTRGKPKESPKEGIR